MGFGMTFEKARRAAARWGLGFAIGTGVALLGGLSARGALAQAAAPFIVMVSTTSTQQSGLFAHLLPAFRKASGIELRVVALGTGQAIDVGRRGDADLLFVHDKVAEQKFVDEGFGLKRMEVMYNDFVIVGPISDPARVKGNDVVKALAMLGKGQAPFISRGDKSGTHAAELRYWKDAGMPEPAATFTGYKQCGCGMGPALNMASSLNGYALSDRGTWLNFKNRGDLAILVEGDKRLFNQYAVIVVNPARHPHVKTALAQTFADWVVSATGQETIASYKISGEQLFFPNAQQ